MTTRNDLPSDKAANFSQRVRETIQVYMGRQGDPLDRGLTLRDLVDSGFLALKSGFNLNSLSGLSTLPLTAGPAMATYEIDLTPPPTPSGFTATALWSNLLIETGAQTYTQGNGHLRTVVYGAKWVSGPLPVFGDAVKITEFSGTVHAYPTNLGTTWHLWAKWQSNDGVLSVSPAGGTNGVVAGTGKIKNVDLNPLIIEAGNLAAGSVTAIKFAPTIEPVTLVTAVPGTKSTSSIFNSTDGFLYRWNGTAYVRTVPAGDISGQLADTQIVALSASKVTGQLTNAQLADLAATKVTGQIVGTQITDGAVVSVKIAAGAIVAGKIAAGTIVAGDIAANAITSVKIQAGSVIAGKLAVGAVQAGNIEALAIAAGDISANAITAGKIAADAVTAGTIAAGAITAGKIAADAIAVGSAAIENGAIRNALIANLAVDDAKIANLAVDKLIAGSLGVGKHISSTNYVAGSAGWKIWDTGAEFSNVTVRGTVQADNGLIGGNTITSTSIASPGASAYGSGSGFYLGSNGTARFGNPAGNRVAWDGTNITIVSPGVNISGGSASFSGDISAATMNTGDFTISSNSGGGWGGIKSAGKWWADGVNGWAFQREGTAGILFEVKASNSRIWMSNWGDCGISFPNFSVDNAGNMTISAANVINTLNIAGNAVTASDSGSGNGYAATNIYVPAGVTAKVFAISVAKAVALEGIFDHALTLNGTTSTTRDYGYIVATTGGSGGGGTNIYSAASSTLADQVTVTGPATVYASCSRASTPMNIILFARFK